MIFIKFIGLLILYFISSDILKFIPILLPIILAVAFFTVFERKILAAMQRRRGPM
jgi:NADH:ubiquinone oxidoreductase subunit H